MRGLRDVETEHWVKAWGIVDNDRRSAEQISKLRDAGIFAPKHFSVEALYYHPEILRRVADRMAAITGKDPLVLFNAAIAGALVEAAKQRDHFVLDAVERLTRRAIFETLPKKADIKGSGTVKIEVNVAALIASENADFDRFIETGDLDAIFQRYSLRESGALASVASSLGLKNRGEYEHAVRVMLQQDAEAMTLLRGFFGELVAEVQPSASDPPAISLS